MKPEFEKYAQQNLLEVGMEHNLLHLQLW